MPEVSHDVFLMSVILFFGTFLLCVYFKKIRKSKFFKSYVSLMAYPIFIELLHSNMRNSAFFISVLIILGVLIMQSVLISGCLHY